MVQHEAVKRQSENTKFQNAGETTHTTFQLMCVILFVYCYIPYPTQVKLAKDFTPDHDLCLEIKYANPFQPQAIIEKGCSSKGVKLSLPSSIV